MGFWDALFTDDYDPVFKKDIEAVRAHIEARMRRSRADDGALLTVIEALARQNHELRTRVGVLIRLLVERGVIFPEELACLLEQTKAAQRPPATAPTVKPKKLPKAPKDLGRTAGPESENGHGV